MHSEESAFSVPASLTGFTPALSNSQVLTQSSPLLPPAAVTTWFGSFRMSYRCPLVNEQTVPCSLERVSPLW
jgi:hypothetical protein